MFEYASILGQEVYKILFLLVPILVSVAMIVWLDRRVWGLVQKRKGPNVVGPFGLLQTVADALKYIFKEKNDNSENLGFENENLKINIKDYYFSNVIARSSKTMIECNNSKLNLKSTGTEG